MGVEDWSLDPDENTDINGTDISEGCPARNVNDAIREIMAAVKETFDDMAEVADEALFPDWSAGTDYGVHRFVRGTDGKLYQSKAASGPSGTAGAQNPVEDTSRTYWAPMPEDDDNVVHKAGAETVAGLKTFAPGVTLGEWSSQADYPENSLATGSDGKLYQSKAASGPSETAGAVDPTADSDETWVPLMPRTGGNFSGELTVKGEDVVHIPNTAGAHNGIFRGKDLTSVYTLAQLHAKLDAGDFSDLYVGDYISKTFTNPAGDSETMDFVFAAFDYYLHSGGGGTYTRTQGYTIDNYECTFHHILMVPRDCFVNLAQMNSSNTTEGAYIGSAMNTLCKTYATKLSANNVFGDYIKPFANWENGKVNTDAYSAAGANMKGSTIFFNNSQNGYDWAVHKVRLMNEVMVYGANCFSSSGYETGCLKSQLPLFRLRPDMIVCGKGLGGARQTYWLSSVVSSAYFAYVNSGGVASAGTASNSSGVRPFFLIA